MRYIILEISLEELIEKERANLSSQNLTKVTLESFISWKKRKIRERKQKEIADEKKKRKAFNIGRQVWLCAILNDEPFYFFFKNVWHNSLSQSRDRGILAFWAYFWSYKVLLALGTLSLHEGGWG